MTIGSKFTKHQFIQFRGSAHEIDCNQYTGYSQKYENYFQENWMCCSETKHRFVISAMKVLWNNKKLFLKRHYTDLHIYLKTTLDLILVLQNVITINIVLRGNYERIYSS